MSVVLFTDRHIRSIQKQGNRPGLGVAGRPMVALASLTMVAPPLGAALSIAVTRFSGAYDGPERFDITKLLVATGGVVANFRARRAPAATQSAARRGRASRGSDLARTGPSDGERARRVPLCPPSDASS